MQGLPHHYRVKASAAEQGEVALQSDDLPLLLSAPPSQFDGPGDRWSPETLLTAAVGDCFVLTFRAVTRAARLKWSVLECDVAGTLDRVDRRTQFTDFEIRAQLRVPGETDVEQARRALEKAEEACLISNSLKARIHLHADVAVSAEAGDIEEDCRLSA